MADTIRTRRSDVGTPRLTHRSKGTSVNTPYFESAKCNDHPDPDWFFNIEANHGVDQKVFCSDCPMIQKCLDYALHVSVAGVWGGTTPDERKYLRKRYNITPSMLNFTQWDTYGDRLNEWKRKKNQSTI